MDTSTDSTTINAAEQALPQQMVVSPFTTYLQSYLVKRGLDKNFVSENITTDVILESLRETQDAQILPSKSQGSTVKQRNSDKVCTGHLQRFLVDHGFKPEFASQITGPHIFDSVFDAMPEDLLPQTPSNQAAQGSDDTTKLGNAPRKDSMFTTPSDDDEDFATKNRRRSRVDYLQDSAQDRPAKRSKPTPPPPALDLSQAYHTLTTECLGNLELSPDSIFHLHLSSERYIRFLTTSYALLSSRFAAVCLTLARASQIQKAIEFAQFAIDLLGPAYFNAHVALCEESREERESMHFSRMALNDCVRDIHNEWDPVLAGELQELVVKQGMSYDDTR